MTLAKASSISPDPRIAAATAPVLDTVDQSASFLLWDIANSRWVNVSAAAIARVAADNNFTTNQTLVGKMLNSQGIRILLPNGVNRYETRTRPPTDDDGTDGDYWEDRLAQMRYGPKADGTWPTGTQLMTADDVIEKIDELIVALGKNLEAQKETNDILAQQLLNQLESQTELPSNVS